MSQWRIESFCQPHASVGNIKKRLIIRKKIGKTAKSNSRLAKTPIINLRSSEVLWCSIRHWSDHKPIIWHKVSCYQGWNSPRFSLINPSPLTRSPKSTTLYFLTYHTYFCLEGLWGLAFASSRTLEISHEVNVRVKYIKVL